MDPFFPDSTSPFDAGDHVALGPDADSRKGTLMSLALESSEPMWLVLLEDGGHVSVNERVLFLIKKAG